MITHGKSIKIFTGNSNPNLAKAICQELGVPWAILRSGPLPMARTLPPSTRPSAARMCSWSSPPAPLRRTAASTR